MFFFLEIGERTQIELIASFSMYCPYCNRNTMHVYGKAIQKLTIYVIPTITLSSKPFVHCSECNYLRIPDELPEKLEALASQGFPPFRICPQCGTRNEMEAVLCQSCSEPVKETILPPKGPARIVAILLTFLFAGLCLLIVIATLLPYF